MTSRHLIDPELAPILELAPDMSVSAEKLEATRERVALMTQMGLAEPDAGVAVSAHHVPGLNGAPDIGIRIYRPAGLPTDAPSVYQIHGGGFLFGTAALGDPRHRAWAKALNAALVSIDYRLAPEHPYPAALDDCYAVLQWLHSEAPALGLDPDRIAVRGESAGGGLAAALCLLAVTTDEPNPFSGQFVWDRPSNAFSWASWLGRPAGEPDVPYLAAPARADDLSGLPPTMIATAALDMFVDENLLYAQRLIRAGVPTEVYVAPGAFHGFEAMVPEARISRAFDERCLDALRHALGS